MKTRNWGNQSISKNGGSCSKRWINTIFNGDLVYYFWRNSGPFRNDRRGMIFSLFFVFIFQSKKHFRRKLDGQANRSTVWWLLFGNIFINTFHVYNCANWSISLRLHVDSFRGMFFFFTDPFYLLLWIFFFCSDQLLFSSHLRIQNMSW